LHTKSAIVPQGRESELRVASCELGIGAGNSQLATRYSVVPPGQIDLDFMGKAPITDN